MGNQSSPCGFVVYALDKLGMGLIKLLFATTWQEPAEGTINSVPTSLLPRETEWKEPVTLAHLYPYSDSGNLCEISTELLRNSRSPFKVKRHNPVCPDSGGGKATWRKPSSLTP